MSIFEAISQNAQSVCINASIVLLIKLIPTNYYDDILTY